MATRRHHGSLPAGDGPSFEEAMEQLEQIIHRIESGQIGLEESLKEYERGVALLRRCRDILNRVQQRVENLTAQMQAEQTVSGPSGPDEDDEERAR